MAKLRVASVPPPGPNPPELDELVLELDELLLVLELDELELDELELDELPEHESWQIEVTSLTQLESHMVSQQ
jgi:hypothetical protein